MASASLNRTRNGPYKHINIEFDLAPSMDTKAAGLRADAAERSMRRALITNNKEDEFKGYQALKSLCQREDYYNTGYLTRDQLAKVMSHSCAKEEAPVIQHLFDRYDTKGEKRINIVRLCDGVFGRRSAPTQARGVADLLLAARSKILQGGGGGGNNNNNLVRFANVLRSMGHPSQQGSGGKKGGSSSPLTVCRAELQEALEQFGFHIDDNTAELLFAAFDATSPPNSTFTASVTHSGTIGSIGHIQTGPNLVTSPTNAPTNTNIRTIMNGSVQASPLSPVVSTYNFKNVGSVSGVAGPSPYLTTPPLTGVAEDLDVQEFLVALRGGPISERRERLVQLAFDQLTGSAEKEGVAVVVGRSAPLAVAAADAARRHNATISFDEMCSLYDPSTHPDVRAGKRSEGEVFEAFVASWSPATTVVTFELFLEYYRGLSAAIDRDEDFEAVIRGDWVSSA